MKNFALFLFIIGIFFSINAFPIYYISPGVHVEYNFKHSFSWGFKLSVGLYTEDNNVANITGGFSTGKFIEEYMELQYMPAVAAPLVGAGLGVSHLHKECEPISALRPRLSVFAGLGLYGNVIYIPLTPKEFPDLRIGTTLVLPVPFNAPSSSFPEIEL